MASRQKLVLRLERNTRWKIMEATDNNTCVELRNLVKRFPSVVAVNHVNLEVKDREVFALLGPSGCGKTTILRIIAGLETADEGEVLIGGKVVNDVAPYRRDCNLVFQNLALFPHMTIQQNIAYGLERKRVPKNEINSRVGEMLEFMGLSVMGNRYPVQLSGGQQQRVALARSLVLKPKLLLLDEPLAALDRKLRKDMQVELKRIQQEVGITFFYVTHDQKVALAISDTIAIMREGRLEQVAPPNQIYDLPRTRFVADFMGATNIFAGKVIEKSKEEVRLQSEEGIMLLALDKEDLASEKITGACVHPEQIKVAPAVADLTADNKFAGRITAMIYQGDFVEIQVLLRETKNDKTITAHLDARLSHANELSVGKQVIAYWDRESSKTFQE
jgi:spermidine/putrescine transport system ATP-binding protein